MFIPVRMTYADRSPWRQNTSLSLSLSRPPNNNISLARAWDIATEIISWMARSTNEPSRQRVNYTCNAFAFENTKQQINVYIYNIADYSLPTTTTLCGTLQQGREKNLGLSEITHRQYRVILNNDHAYKFLKKEFQIHVYRYVAVLYRKRVKQSKYRRKQKRNNNKFHSFDLP